MNSNCLHILQRRNKPFDWQINQIVYMCSGKYKNSKFPTSIALNSEDVNWEVAKCYVNCLYRINRSSSPSWNLTWIYMYEWSWTRYQREERWHQYQLKQKLDMQNIWKRRIECGGGKLEMNLDSIELRINGCVVT